MDRGQFQSKTNMGVVADLKAQLQELIPSLEAFFKAAEASAAIDLLVKHHDLVDPLVALEVPLKAQKEIGHQKRCNWPDGCGFILSEAHSELIEKVRDRRWDPEIKVLEAQHPDRVARLWKEHCALFEERYGRSFASRDQLVYMFGIYDAAQSVQSTFNRALEVQHYHNALSSFHATKPDFLPEVYQMAQQTLGQRSLECARSLIAFLSRFTEDPAYAQQTSTEIVASFQEDLWEGAVNLLDFPLEDPPLSPKFSIPDLTDEDYSISTINDLAFLCQALRTHTMPFFEGLALINRQLTDDIGYKLEFTFGYPEHLPYSLKDPVCAELKHLYQRRSAGDEASLFISHFAKRVLERWKSSAPDYESRFRYHELSPLEAILFSTYWSVREGRYIIDVDKTCKEKRIPELLQALLEDGIIEEKQIDPPLLSHYPTPEEIASLYNPASPHALNVGRQLSAALPKEAPRALITTSGAQVTLLAEAEKSFLPAATPKTDLSALAEIVNPEATYVVLYRGKHTLLLGEQGCFPNGDQRIGQVLRLALLAEGAETDQGVNITIAGQQLLVSEQSARQDLKKMSAKVFDARSNLIPISSYVVMVDVSPDVFREKYFGDFIAHTLVHADKILLGPSYAGRFAHIDKLPTLGLSIGLGNTERSSFNTLELNGRFCFKISRGQDSMLGGKADYIAQSLCDYLSEVGLTYSINIEMDESSRAITRLKQGERSFYEDHIDNVVAALKGPGLAYALAHVVQDKKYRLFNFFIAAENCEHCQQAFYTGIISRPDLGEQWSDGFRAGELHELANHPDTFEAEFGRLEKIHRMLEDVKKTPPCFVTYPELQPLLASFEISCRTLSKAEAAAYSFWDETQGGIDAEPEQIAEDPELQRLAKLEKQLNDAENEARAEATAMAIALDKRFPNLNNFELKNEPEPDEILTFWSQQVVIYKIYQTCAPELLSPPNIA